MIGGEGHAAPVTGRTRSERHNLFAAGLFGLVGRLYVGRIILGVDGEALRLDRAAWRVLTWR
jgi:hypothetical protein